MLLIVGSQEYVEPAPYPFHIAQLALPNNQDPPARPLEVLSRAAIAQPVCLKLRQPEVDAGFRHARELARLARMTMPKTPVHENHSTARPENHVGSPW
jgi:hypothetical protein